jgi:hypothetical protein
LKHSRTFVDASSLLKNKNIKGSPVSDQMADFPGFPRIRSISKSFSESSPLSKDPNPKHRFFQIGKASAKLTIYYQQQYCNSRETRTSTSN